MGGDAINSDDMKSYYHSSPISYATSASQVFHETQMIDAFNPAKMKLPREARDSALSPHSRGIILAEDVTGSMDSYLFDLIKDRFPSLIQEIYKIATYNPHIMFMGIGDVEQGDRAPLQVTQFETDLRMLDQLQKIWLERGGGTNSYESYILPWYFAGNCISMDCYEKRGEKGFLFTFGDEEPTPYLYKNDLARVFGNRSDVPLPRQNKIYFEDCLEMASEKFHCYHVILHGYGYSYDSVTAKWEKEMPGHVCDLSDHECIVELVITILKMYNGMSKSDAIASIGNSHARTVVEKALKNHEEIVKDEAKPMQTVNIEEF